MSFVSFSHVKQRKAVKPKKNRNQFSHTVKQNKFHRPDSVVSRFCDPFYELVEIWVSNHSACFFTSLKVLALDLKIVFGLSNDLAGKLGFVHPSLETFAWVPYWHFEFFLRKFQSVWRFTNFFCLLVTWRIISLENVITSGLSISSKFSICFVRSIRPAKTVPPPMFLFSRFFLFYAFWGSNIHCQSCLFPCGSANIIGSMSTLELFSGSLVLFEVLISCNPSLFSVQF